MVQAAFLVSKLINVYRSGSCAAPVTTTVTSNADSDASSMSRTSGDWAFSRFTQNCNLENIELVWNVQRICIFLCGGLWNLSKHFQVMKCSVFTKIFHFVCACAWVCARARVRECAFVRVYVVDLFLNRWFSVIKMHYDMLMKPKRICFLFSTMIYDWKIHSIHLEFFWNVCTETWAAFSFNLTCIQTWSFLSSFTLLGAGSIHDVCYLHLLC